MTPEQLTYFLDRLSPTGLRALEESRMLSFGKDLLRIDDSLEAEDLRDIYQGLQFRLGIKKLNFR